MYKPFTEYDLSVLTPLLKIMAYIGQEEGLRRIKGLAGGYYRRETLCKKLSLDLETVNRALQCLLGPIPLIFEDSENRLHYEMNLAEAWLTLQSKVTLKVLEFTEPTQ